MCYTIQESSHVAVSQNLCSHLQTGLAKTATFLTNHSFRSEISRDHPLFATLSGVLYTDLYRPTKVSFEKWTIPLETRNKNQTIESCDSCYIIDPRHSKDQYTHKLSYYNSVVSCLHACREPEQGVMSC